MVTKKDLITAVLLTFCLTTVLFTITPTRSAPEDNEYDPWCDINDDGVIDIFDVVSVTGIYGKKGTPIDKIMLLELQSRIDSLNTTVIQLMSDLGRLNSTLAQQLSQIAGLNATIAEQRLEMESLNASIVALTTRIDLIEAYVARYGVTFNSTYGYYAATTETMDWVDMTNMSLTITLEKASDVLIMFSTEARISFPADYISIRAMVGDVSATPENTTLIPTLDWQLGWPSSHSHNLGTSVYSYNFLKASVSPGTHTIEIQWRVTGNTGYTYYKTLEALAFPTQ